MRFVELVNFNNAPVLVLSALRAELHSAYFEKDRWVEWNSAMVDIVPVPDLTLVYAAKLDWKSVKLCVDDARGEVVALFGSSGPILGLPRIQHITELESIAATAIDRGGVKDHITSKHAGNMAPRWTSTIPVSIQAAM